MRAATIVAVLVCAWLLAGPAPLPPLGTGYLDYPITAQDEAVYSHAAIAMVESGDWSTPTFLGRFFLYKPPLLYWLSGASAKLFGVSAWSLRLPSILAAALTAGLVFVWVRREAKSQWRAAVAVLLLAMSPLYTELGRRNMTDSLVMACIVSGAWFLARGSPLHAVSVCIAAGILAKSVAGLIPAIVMGLWWAASVERPPLKRVVLVAALGFLIAAPWFIYQWETHRRWFEAEFIGVELLAYGASAPPQTSQEAAPLFYARRLWEQDRILCLAFLASLPALIQALRRRRSNSAVALGSALAVMAAAVLAYQYRNATYLLPVLPLMAIAAGTHAPVWGLAAAALVGAWGRGVQPPAPANPAIPLLRLAEQYCGMQRGNDLIVIGIADDFSISTLPLAKLRYAIRGAARSAGQVTLDFHRMGIVLTVDEFNDRAGHSNELRAWGLPNDDALGTVISWDSADDLSALMKANPEIDFLFSEGGPPSTETHRTVAARGAASLLFSPHALPRLKPPTRTCKM